MDFDKNKPYNRLPELPPELELETKKVLKATISAKSALATMMALCKQLPNESIFYNSIFLQEAKDSSEIENIVTTNDELYQALSSDRKTTNPNTKEVLRYVDALWAGFRTMRNTKVLTTRVFIDIVNTIRQNNEGARKNPGVKIINKKSGEIIYTPPEGEDVILNKLKNLEQYINTEDDIDPLIKMAVIHYQFEAIHPFSDGNGRTGRIINILYLVLIGLLDHPLLFLSKYIIDNKNNYYLKLKNVTEKNEWENWLLYMLNGIEETSQYMTKKIEKIVKLMRDTKYLIRDKAPKIYSKELLEVIFQQPYCKIKFLENAGIAKEVTASKYLKQLEALDLLSVVKVGREKLYVHKEFYRLLKH